MNDLIASLRQGAGLRWRAGRIAIAAMAGVSLVLCSVPLAGSAHAGSTQRVWGMAAGAVLGAAILGSMAHGSVPQSRPPKRHASTAKTAPKVEVAVIDASVDPFEMKTEGAVTVSGR